MSKDVNSNESPDKSAGKTSSREIYISSLAIDQVALLITKRTLYEELIKQK